MPKAAAGFQVVVGRFVCIPEAPPEPVGCMSITYPDRLEIQPLTAPPHATIRVPGSKSITNRALVLAAGAPAFSGSSSLRGAFDCEESQVMIQALRELDAKIRMHWPKEECTSVWGWTGHDDRSPPVDEFNLFVANSGTTMRFLTAFVSTGQGRFRLDGV